MLPPRPSVPSLSALRLEFLLQSMEDRSMIVPASQVWTRGERMDWATGGENARQDPAESLLAGLGRDNRLYPPLQPALRIARPSPAISTPPRPTGSSPRPPPCRSRPASESSCRPGGRDARPGWGQAHGEAGERFGVPVAAGGQRDLRPYEWQVAIGDHALTVAELERLAALNAPLVQVRGQCVELGSEEVAAHLQRTTARRSGLGRPPPPDPPRPCQCGGGPGTRGRRACWAAPSRVADLDLVEMPTPDGNPFGAILPRRHSPSSRPRTLVTKPPGAAWATISFTSRRASALVPLCSAAVKVAW